MTWERIDGPGLLRGLRRSPTRWVIIGMFIVVASSTSCTTAAETTDSASGGIPALEKIAPADVVATLSAERRRYSHLLMLPVGQNPGVLRESGKGRCTFSLVRPGKAPVRLWSGRNYWADVLCAADNSGFILAEYEYDRYGRDRKVIATKVFNASGKETASYLPERKCGPRAGLSGGRSLWVEAAGQEGNNFLWYDSTGNLLGEAGPFKAKETAWSDDGSRLLVNVGEEVVGIEGGRGFGGESTKILIVDMAQGKVLVELPPAYRGQLSPQGRLAITADKGKLRIWKEGKEVRAFDLGTRSTMAVFSPDGRYVSFGVGRAIHVYRTDDWARTMAVEPSEESQWFASDSVSLSNTGRVMVVSVTLPQPEHSPTNLICLYDSHGALLWEGRYPWKDGRPTMPGISRLTPDGREAYIRVGEKLVRVPLTDE